MASADLAQPDVLLPSRAHTLICGAITLLGAVGVLGWIFRSAEMVGGVSGMIPMVFNTALCFLLSGTALLLSHRRGDAARRAGALLAFLVVLLCGAVSIEILLDKPLLVDFAFLHSWYDYGNNRPGRMAPNSAIGFLLIGTGILLADRVTNKSRAIAAVVITFCVLAVGLTGLLGYLLAPDLLFDWARSARMAVPTCAGIILCSLALRMTWSTSGWYASDKYFRQDQKIRILGPATIVVATVTAALAGFVLLQLSFEKFLQSRLQTTLDDRRALLTTTIQQAIQTVLTADRLSRLGHAGDMVLLASDRKSPGAAAGLLEAELVAANLRGITVESGGGTIVATFGNPTTAPAIAAAANEDGTAELLWDGELILRMRVPLTNDKREIGALLIDQSAASLDRQLFDGHILGSTGEIAACIRKHAEIRCFPGDRHTAPFAVSLSSTASARLPMRLALDGRAGNVVGIDYRGRNVIAAYGLLAPGLGIVVKVDTAELYTSIRDALRVGSPLFLVIAILGATMLYLQIKPLTVQMRLSEARALEGEFRMRAIVESVGEGILRFDDQGVIREVNPAVCDIFGYQSCELVGRSTGMLMAQSGEEPAHRRLQQHIPRNLVALAGRRNHKLSGCRKNGTEVPIEITINAITFAGTRTFVGVLRDITERMETERKLTALSQYDSLTGLPNRSLFMDRMSMAAVRMDRLTTGIALIFLDVDGFKGVNDEYGHRAGDDLLIQFAARLRAPVRESDTVARLAGDEFTIILEGLSDPMADARRVAEKIIASLATPFLIEGKEVTVTASLGLVVPPCGGFNTADLLARADSAMYAAKHAGKNCVIAA